MKSLYRLARVILPAAILTLTIGCGGGNDANPVEGRVTLDGNPLSGATVVFSPADGSSDGASGITDENGVYTLFRAIGGDVGEGAVAGDYVVTVSKAPVATGNAAASGSSDAMPNPTASTAAKSEVHTKYNRAETSGLTATVVDGTNNDINFELLSSP